MKIWDPSGRMSQAYRVQASLEEAANALENPEGFVQPVVGVPISVSFTSSYERFLFQIG